MKWFQHDCDMHTDLKVQALIQKHGAEGYATWNLCLELLGKEGKGGKLMASTLWKECLSSVLYQSNKEVGLARIDKILDTMATLRLIDAKSLNNGNLYVPKFLKRADNWTKKLLRSSDEDTSQKVPLYKNILDKIILHYIRLKGWEEKNLNRSDYARVALTTKKLLKRTNGSLELITEGMDWIAKRGWDWWTLETLDKYWADFMKHKDKGAPAASREIDLSQIGK